jgi:hypothetical protein
MHSIRNFAPQEIGKPVDAEQLIEQVVTELSRSAALSLRCSLDHEGGEQEQTEPHSQPQASEALGGQREEEGEVEESPPGDQEGVGGAPPQQPSNPDGVVE